LPGELLTLAHWYHIPVIARHPLKKEIIDTESAMGELCSGVREAHIKPFKKTFKSGEKLK